MVSVNSIYLQVVISDGKAVFYPGDTLHGSVVIQLKDTLEAKALVLKFLGKAHWENEDEYVGCNGRGYLFNNEVTLVDPQLQKRESTIILDSGYHSFPFEFILPEDLPSSYRHQYDGKHWNASVSYTIEAIVKRKFYEPNVSSPVEFRVQEVRALMAEDLNEPNEVVIAKEVRSFFGFSYGTSHVTLSVPKRGYYLGENIEANVSIDHAGYGNQTGEVTLEFLRETSYLYPKDKAKKTVQSTAIKRSLLHETIQANSMFKCTDVIHIPENIIPEVYVKDSLYIKYWLQLKIRQLTALNINCRLPLTIVKSPQTADIEGNSFKLDEF